MPAVSQADEWVRLEEELALKAARTSFLGFMAYVSPDNVIARHHRAWAKLIHEMIWGQSRRIIISCPPRHGKTETFSRHLPAFILGLNPDASIIATSYGADLAQRNNRDVQRIMTTPEYERAFPDTRLFGSNVRSVAGGTWLRNADIFEVVGRKGVYKCAGTGGPITGAGGLWLLADDLLRNAEDAASHTIKEKQWEWWQSTLRTRLAKDGRIILVMTRWSDSDVPGRLIDLAKADPNADQYTVVNFPAIKDDKPSELDPRQPGEALWPAFFPVPDLLKVKANNARVFQSLYQGDPVPPGGNIVKSSWWRFYVQAELPRRFESVIITCDLTFKDGEKSDYTVMQVFGKAGGQAWLLDQVRRKISFVAQIDALVALRERWQQMGHPIREIIVEAAANGEALVSALRSTIPNIIAVPPGRSSKLTRAEVQTPIIEAGNLRIPSPKERPWVSDFMMEWERFPHGKNDDIVDATTMALKRIFPAKANYSGAAPILLKRPSGTRPYI